MPKFRCKTSVTHNGKDYQPGCVVELTEAQAAAMPWAIELAPSEPAFVPPSAPESPPLPVASPAPAARVTSKGRK